MRTSAEWYLWVSKPCRIWVQVVLDTMQGSRKCHSSKEQHHQHDKWECGCEVGSLHLNRKGFLYNHNPEKWIPRTVCFKRERMTKTRCNFRSYYMVLWHLPQNATRDIVERLLQVHKAHVDWLGKLLWTLEHPVENILLFQCSTARTETVLFLLNPRFDYWPDSPLQYPGIDFPREAEECDPLIVGTHPVASTFNFFCSFLLPTWIFHTYKKHKTGGAI